MSDRLWSQLGPEIDAAYTVDATGTACANGGFSVTLRDFGRFGQMILQNGFYNGRQIVPAKVVDGFFSGDNAKFIGNVQKCGHEINLAKKSRSPS